MTGYRAFSYLFVKTFPVLSRGFEIETEMSIHAIDKNLYVENVVIEYRDRPEGSESKLNTYSDGAKVLMTIVKLFRNYKPLRFFSLLSLLIFIIAFIFFLPVMIDYIRTGLVDRFPTLIACGFMVLASIVSLFSGIILDNIRQKSRQDFERSLIEVSQRMKD